MLHPQDDMFVVVRRASPLRVAMLVGSAAVLLTLCAVPHNVAALLGLSFALALVLAPFLAVAAWRALAVQRRVIVRRPGRLLVDGDPVEFARVELRVIEPPFRRRAKRFALSLWVMAPNGPEDILLGAYQSLVLASLQADEWETFLRKANLKQPGKSRKRAG